MENKNLLKQNRRPTKAGQLASILIRDSNVLHNRINEKIITNISLFEGPFCPQIKTTPLLWACGQGSYTT